MMFGINAFSSIFTLASLIMSGELFSSFRFLAQNTDAIFHICAFSAFGAIGQTFIFLTIKEFGPLVFTIVSTIRQLLAIILSVIIFGHHVAAQGMVGIVFFLLQEQKQSRQCR
jgi:adenosine 3'-phospho 5'-phosphosulfate transporter B2